jgi:hypothetical protein
LENRRACGCEVEVCALLLGKKGISNNRGEAQMRLSFLAKALACGRGERIYQAFLLRYGYGADFGNADVGHFALLSGEMLDILPFSKREI